MAVKLDKNLYFNMNKTRKETVKQLDSNGNWVDAEVEVYGVWEEGVKNPDTHTVTFGEPADATTAARDKAVELGVDVNSVEGTGSEGRVTVGDVEKAANAGAAPQAS